MLKKKACVRLCAIFAIQSVVVKVGFKRFGDVLHKVGEPNVKGQSGDTTTKLLH